MEIYFPMTCNILTPGHVKCLEYLTEYGFVTVGLLTKKALKGYKEEFAPFKDRKFLLETVGAYIGDITVVAQNSLDPMSNLKDNNYDAIASGDGWEKEEILTAKKLGLRLIDIKLPKEKKKKYSSSKIIKLIKKL